MWRQHAWEPGGLRQRRMGMRTCALFLVLGLVVASAVLGVGAAGADCVGPEITYDVRPVAAGQVVRVTGEYWGTDCYDTGNRPRDEGVLGPPQTDIEVVVLQDGVGPVVARGDADADYRFVVDVPIPGSLHAGTVIIVARADDPGPRFAFGPEIPVAEGAATAVTATPTDPVMFADSPNPVGPGGDEGADGRPWLIGGVALVVVLAAGLAWWGRRRAPGPRSGEAGSA